MVDTDAAGPVEEDRDHAETDRAETDRAETDRAVGRGAAERLMFFSDAVVAIAITLLAIDLPAPTGDTNAELARSLVANSFAYVTFVISFLVVGAHWRVHHRIFRYLDTVDPPFVRITFVWLLIIVATPFLTVIIREGRLDLLRFGLYAAAQALLSGVLNVMQWWAARHRLFVATAPAAIARPRRSVQLAGVAAYLVSIPLYPLLGAWSFALWALVPQAFRLVRLAARHTGRRSAGG